MPRQTRKKFCWSDACERLSLAVIFVGRPLFVCLFPRLCSGQGTDTVQMLTGEEEVLDTSTEWKREQDLCISIQREKDGLRACVCRLKCMGLRRLREESSPDRQAFWDEVPARLAPQAQPDDNARTRKDLQFSSRARATERRQRRKPRASERKEPTDRNESSPPRPLPRRKDFFVCGDRRLLDRPLDIVGKALLLLLLQTKHSRLDDRSLQVVQKRAFSTKPRPLPSFSCPIYHWKPNH